MDNNKTNTAVLFDFDGVVIDTETQYSVFWHRIGIDYLGITDLETRIKGQTLTYIYETFLPNMAEQQKEITAALDQFEQQMTFDFIPGVLEFIDDLRRHNVPMAVVTSSNDKKMAAVRRVHPDKCLQPQNLHPTVFCWVCKYLDPNRIRLGFSRIHSMVYEQEWLQELTSSGLPRPMRVKPSLRCAMLL